MTIRAIIDLLRTYPEDMRVVVSGYEQGYDNLSPEQISVVPVTLNTGINQWEGWHRNLHDFPSASREEAETITEVLALHRTSN